MTKKLTAADQSVIAVERAIRELRAGRPVWLDDVLFAAAEDLSASATEVPDAAIQLLKLAHLLPVALSYSDEGEAEWLKVAAEQVEHYQEAIAQTLVEVSAAHLPLKYAENVQVKVFRPLHGAVEHLAVIFGVLKPEEVPLVRIHSSCLTGDLLGSLRCDCGDQLHLALEAIAKEGAGVLCYLNQEGRGIGLGNKIRAYALQEAGQDTLQANESLGFKADERDFAVAAAMLKQLGVSQVRLLTNNPKKLEELAHYDVKVSERVPLVVAPHAHNQVYMDTKAKRFGHLI